MRRVWFGWLALMAAAGMAPAAEVLVWHDEFEGEALDGAKWTAEQGLVRNDRAAQLYRADPANLTVADGVLRLTATFDEAGYSNPFYGKNGWEDWRSYTKSKPYASGSVNSFGKFSMRYGRVAVRARFNVASGAWPAIWMLGTTQTPPANLADPEAFWRCVSTVPWPQCGEIDLMEYATRDGDGAEAAAQARQTIHSTLHWGDSWTGPAYKMDGETLLCKDLDQADLAAAAWHEYGLEWTPERLAVTVDGKTVLERDPGELVAPTSGETPFADNLFHFVLNLALGSMANDPPKDGAGYPIAHEIDYVRVWQDPEVAGNRLLIGGKAPAFAGFACDDPDATPLIPADATVGADGGLTLAGGPLAVGGFVPTTAFTLTAEVTVPEGATGTLLGFRSGANEVRIASRAAGELSAFYDGWEQVTGAQTVALAPGRHTLRLTYDSERPNVEGTARDSVTSGTRVWVDGALAYASPRLVWSRTAVPFLTFGNDASDAPASPMAGLTVHAATLRLGVAESPFVCTDGGAQWLLPAGPVCEPELVLSGGPLRLSGFAAGHAAVAVTVDATLPEGAEGALVGWEMTHGDGEVFTAQAEACAAEADPIRHSGETAHVDTVTYGRPAAGRHLWTLVYSIGGGAALWEDGRLLAEAPGIKWSGAPLTAITFGATPTGGLPLAGLRLHAARVDFARAAAPENPVAALYEVPDALRGLGVGPLLHLLRVRGALTVPEVSVNGERLGDRDAALALWAFGMDGGGAAEVAVGRLEVGDRVSVTLSDGTPALRNGALSLLGARTLGGAWERLAAFPAPVAAGATLEASAPGFPFLKVRAEETAGAPGPLADLRPAAPAERPLAAGSGTATLLGFAFAGDPADLGAAGRTTLTLTLSGTGLVPGGLYTLTIDGVAHAARLETPEGAAATGTLTFTGLAVTDGAQVTLAGPTDVNGSVSVAAGTWGGTGTTAHIAAVVADDLVKDGFVPADSALASERTPEGYDATIYRIPALATDGAGGVVAVYDVRYGSGDLGDFRLSGIDLGESFSADFGRTWGKPRLAVDVDNFRAKDGSYPYGKNQAKITKEMDIGDAALLFDPEGERYWLMAITGGGLSYVGENSERNDCVLYSRGVGPDAKWEGRRSVKADILEGIGRTANPGRGVLAGPGHGMVTQIGRAGMPKGTLVFPVQAFVNNGTGDAQCCAVYSTDGGKTWQTTGLTPKTLAQAPHNAQENCVMELDDGSWLMMSKGGSWGAGNGRRLFFRTTDFKTWTQLADIPNVIHVQGSCLRIGTGADGVGRYVLAHQLDPDTRARLALVFGRDLTADNPDAGQEGVDWDLENPLVIHAGATGGQGYVSLCLLDETTLGVLYEANNQIRFERIDLAPYLR